MLQSVKCPPGHMILYQSFTLPALSGGFTVRIFGDPGHDLRLVWADLITAVTGKRHGQMGYTALCAESEHETVTISEALSLLSTLSSVSRVPLKVRAYIHTQFQAFHHRLLEPPPQPNTDRLDSV